MRLFSKPMKTEMTARISRRGECAPASRGRVTLAVGLMALLAAAPDGWGQPEITTLAGGPVVVGGPFFGFVDGPSLQESQFNQPSGVALDSQGNLFLADRNNDRVRK